MEGGVVVVTAAGGGRRAQPAERSCAGGGARGAVGRIETQGEVSRGRVRVCVQQLKGKGGGSALLHGLPPRVLVERVGSESVVVASLSGGPCPLPSHPPPGFGGEEKRCCTKHTHARRTPSLSRTAVENEGKIKKALATTHTHTHTLSLQARFGGGKKSGGKVKAGHHATTKKEK